MFQKDVLTAVSNKSRTAAWWGCRGLSCVCLLAEAMNITCKRDLKKRRCSEAQFWLELEHPGPKTLMGLGWGRESCSTHMLLGEPSSVPFTATFKESWSHQRPLQSGKTIFGGGASAAGERGSCSIEATSQKTQPGCINSLKSLIFARVLEIAIWFPGFFTSTRRWGCWKTSELVGDVGDPLPLQPQVLAGGSQPRGAAPAVVVWGGVWLGWPGLQTAQCSCNLMSWRFCRLLSQLLQKKLLCQHFVTGPCKPLWPLSQHSLHPLPEALALPPAGEQHQKGQESPWSPCREHHTALQGGLRYRSLHPAKRTPRGKAGPLCLLPAVLHWRDVTSPETSPGGIRSHVAKEPRALGAGVCGIGTSRQPRGIISRERGGLCKSLVGIGSFLLLFIYF